MDVDSGPSEQALSEAFECSTALAKVARVGWMGGETKKPLNIICQTSLHDAVESLLPLEKQTRMV